MTKTYQIQKNNRS